MRVKSVSTYPTEAQIVDLGEGFHRAQQFPMEAGKSYLVLGISFYIKASIFGKGLIFEIEDSDGEPASVPACLVIVEDPRASSLWELRINPGKVVHLWPPSFYQEFYHDDLSEGVPEVVEDYKRVVSLLRAEEESG